MPSRQDTRERLIETARQLFLQKGYTATGVAEILRQARLNAGSLYHFFPTKEDLLLAVLERYKELLGPLVLEPVFSRISDPMERVFGILDGYRRMLLTTNQQQGCPIGNLALELSTTHPAARRIIAENFTAWRNAVANCLRQASGRLPARVDSDQLALFVLTVMEGAVMLARAYHSITVYDAAVAQLRDYLDRLIVDGTHWTAPAQSARKSKQSKRKRSHLSKSFRRIRNT